MRSRRALAAALLLVVALALRVGEVERTEYQPINDAGFYMALASQVAHTGDYSTSQAPGTGAGGTRGPTAYFPPAFPYFLALVDLVDGHIGSAQAPGANPAGATFDPHGVQPARISQAVVGAITVELIGLVALEAFGPGVALLALALGAVYPVLIELSAVLVAENLLTAFILASMWAALRSRRSENPYRWLVASGVFAGLASLAHVNAVVILIPLALAAWRARRSPLAPGIVVAATVLTLTPWLVRNAVTMHRFVPVSDENGITLVGTYNNASASDPQVPYRWRLYFSIPGEQALGQRAHSLTEPELSDRLQSHAFDYISAHPASPLSVLYHNSRRMLELEGSTAWKISASSLDIPTATARIGVLSFWVLCLLAVAGAFTKVVRRGPWWLWTAPVLLWLSSAFVNGETPRFREPVDPFLILLGACAVATLVGWATSRLGRSPVRSEGGGAGPASAGQGVQVSQGLA
jgi:4-amino-4-deoxy-L-arabinose transferase-like glycosyltransferase